MRGRREGGGRERGRGGGGGGGGGREGGREAQDKESSDSDQPPQGRAAPPLTSWPHMLHSYSHSLGPPSRSKSADLRPL